MNVKKNMKKTPKISIIIPIYNKEEHLRQCLNSVVNQTFNDIEIVCVNDGSTDASLDILNEYSKKYSNIIIINQKNKGVNGARITGYENSTGDYIAWVDADDFIEINMYEKMYKLASQNDADVVICNYNFYPKHIKTKEKWYKPYTGKLDWKFLLYNTIQWNKIVKRSLLNKLDIVELFSKVGEGCYSLVLINANSITTTDECLYNYRVGHSSLSTNFNNIEWYKATVNRALCKYKYVKKKKYDLEWQKFFKYIYLRYVLILLLISAFNNNMQLYLENKKTLKENNFFDGCYDEYLIEDFSRIKLFVFKNIFSKSFALTKLATKIYFK